MSGSERGSRSGDGQRRSGPECGSRSGGHERLGARQQELRRRRGEAPGPSAGSRMPAFIFFVCQKYFGTGWSFQPVPIDV